MKKSLITLALAAACGAAAAAGPGVYAGVRMNAQHTDIPAAAGLDRDNASVEFYVGRPLGRSASVELSGAELGKVGSGSAEIGGRFLAVDGVYRHKLSNKLALTAQAGLAYTEASLAGASPSRLAPTVGAGVEYNLTKATYLQAKWRHLNGVGVASNHVDTVGVGLGMRF